MNHLVIDTEFLSLRCDAKILSIGLAVFSDTGHDVFQAVLAKGYYILNLDSMPEGTVSHETFHWWMGQEERARKALGEPGQPQHLMEHAFYSPGPVSIRYALTGIQGMYKELSCKRVWSHGAACDIPLLNHWYALRNMQPPWHYRDVRDTRTLYDLTAHKNFGKLSGYVKHKADDDADREARNIFMALKEVRG